MSILASQLPTFVETPEVIALRKAQSLKYKTDRILSSGLRLATLMEQEWSKSFDELWNDPEFTPQELLASVGTHAAELIQINTAFVAFMTSQLQGKNNDLLGKIQAKVASMPVCKIKEDGTATIA